MRKRDRAKRLATRVLCISCGLCWGISHTKRQTWQARALLFEGLLAKFSPQSHRAAYVEVLQLDELFERSFSRMRDRFGHDVVRESQTRTGGRAFDELKARILH